MPACVNVVCVRTAVYINHRRIFLVRVEVHRLHHSPIQVSRAVVGLQRTARVFRHLVSLLCPGVLGVEEQTAFAVLRVDGSDAAWNLRTLVIVAEVFSACAQYGSFVPSLAVAVDELALAGGNVNRIDVILQRVRLV